MGGEKSFGPTMATVMRFAASDVSEDVVPDSGHWIMEENSDRDGQSRDHVLARQELITHSSVTRLE